VIRPEEPHDIHEIQRRREVAVAGHRGNETAARSALTDGAAGVRAAALGALERMGRLSVPDVMLGLRDRSARVRRRACGVSVGLAEEVVATVVACLADEDDSVVEAACFALGERGRGAGQPAIGALSQVATKHRDPLCREAAVAALGAIGDGEGLAAILLAMSDKPAVRRRAVLALAPFGGPDVEAALRQAVTDRDWQVRQAAVDLVGTDPAGGSASGSASGPHP
jgi:HEAT repeat protein